MQKKIYSMVSIIFVLTFALVACGAKSESESWSAQDEYIYEEAAEAPMAEPAASYDGGEMDDMYTAVEAEEMGLASNEVERIVLKNANLSIEVGDPAAVMDMIVRMTERRGGFVVNSSLYSSYYGSQAGDVMQGNITIRVPAAQLNDAMDEVKNLTADPKYDVISQNISGQDVTREYTDLQSRLRNLEATAEQLQVIMDEAFKTEDVLQVYNELSRINSEIEVIKGQIKYYEEASSMSSIYIDILPKLSDEPIDTGGWEPKGIVNNALQALVNAFQFVVEALIWIGLFVLPLVALLAIPLVILILVVKALIRRSKKRKADKKAE